jgi:3-hydroxy-9,10-secoandrosta-1,3,5(10)-triene-9,17-dione monooxygenase
MASTASVPVPEPDLTPDELVARARQLVPFLRERAGDIERSGSITPEVDEALRRAGLYRVLQPRCAGGYEFDVATFVDAMLEVFRGDGSAGWVACFMAAHILWVTALDPDAQREVFGADGDVRTVVPAAPTGVANPVEGGYRVTGRWDYSSGFAVSNWFMSLAVVDRATPGPSADAPPEIIVFAAPSASLVADDNWRVMGLQGSGSVSASASDVFVPASHCYPFVDMLFGFQAPGYGSHDNALYRAPVLPILWMQLAIAMVGITQGLLDVFIDDTSRKAAAFPPFGPLLDDKKVQLALGEALADHGVATAALRQLVVNHAERVRLVACGATIEWLDIQQDHLLVTKLARLCIEAADALFQVAGSTMPIKLDSAFRRFYVDLKVASTHRALSFERASENGAMIAFGLTPATNH